MREWTSRLDSFVFEFLERREVARIDLDRGEPFPFDADFGLELNRPTGRFSAYRQSADELSRNRFRLLL